MGHACVHAIKKVDGKKMIGRLEIKQLVSWLWDAYQNPSDDNELHVRLILPILAVVEDAEIKNAAISACSYFIGADSTNPLQFPRLCKMRYRGFVREVHNLALLAGVCNGL